MEATRKNQGQCALDSETIGCILFSGKIYMPAMSSAEVCQGRTLLETCLKVMLNEDVDLRKWCKKEQTEWATGEFWAFVEQEIYKRYLRGDW